MVGDRDFSHTCTFDVSAIASDCIEKQIMQESRYEASADWMILKRHAKCVCVHGTSVLTIINLGVFYL